MNEGQLEKREKKHWTVSGTNNTSNGNVRGKEYRMKSFCTTNLALLIITHVSVSLSIYAPGHKKRIAIFISNSRQ